MKQGGRTSKSTQKAKPSSPRSGSDEVPPSKPAAAKTMQPKSEAPKAPSSGSQSAFECSSPVIESITALLEHARPERRSAGAIVLGELAPQDEAVIERLRAAVQRADDAPLRRFAAEAIGAIEPSTIVTDLQPLLKDPDRAVRETVGRVLASARGASIGEIAKMLESRDEKERLAAIAVLGAKGGRVARRHILSQLKGASVKGTNAVVDALRPSLSAVEGDEAREAIEDIEAILDPRAIADDPDFAIAAVQLLGHISDGSSVDVLMRIASSDASPEVRANAVDAVRKVVKGKKPDVRVFKFLLECLEDRTQDLSVIGAVIDALAGLDVPLALEPRVRGLLGSESQVVRRFAIRVLGGLDTAPAAKAIVKVVESGDPADREAALEVARETTNGRAELARLLGRTEDEARARAIAAALRAKGEEVEVATRQLLEAMVVEVSPSQAEIIIGLLKGLGGASATKVQDSLLEKALKLKKKESYQDAIAIFRSICHGQNVDPEARFQLGVCELKASKKAIGRGPSNDPCVATFNTLARHRDFPMLERLKDEKVLEPEDLYYLGFTLAEGNESEQGLGGEILSFLAEDEGSRLGKMAKNKLVTMGWEE